MEQREGKRQRKRERESKSDTEKEKHNVEGQQEKTNSKIFFTKEGEGERKEILTRKIERKREEKTGKLINILITGVEGKEKE